ncbi:HalX domain-containing protein [Halarchaeum nitratireducens]|uniref:DNA-binding protein n=1 Tax=Halarchaeum nitratireducens TaxID=489913 RepID=A0A830GC56_9EURY|nr:MULTISPECIES: HalX domain-containing protein [Halarchaeum]MBP2250708.1 DNA-binding response OmpR family regulator [Halarchaeum solikamskense]GGN16298.1 DNA-binding protein [Halarchaeum nitratireducens]
MTDRPTVLVVEDDRDLADLYAAWLEGDHDVRTANSAAEALDQFDGDIDVVLLDRRLPESSGDDVLAELRETGSDVQIAMVSAVDPDFDIIEMGFDAYLVKPVSRDELTDLVSRLLARRLYTVEVREYFSLAAKRAALETQKDADQLADNEEYQRLVADIEALEGDLDEELSNLDDDDVAAVFRSLRAHGDE